jgi:hypothetical protein
MRQKLRQKSVSMWAYQAVLRIRIRSDPDPESSPPNPDPDPALVVLKKYLFLCNIVHMYIYLLRRCDSLIGIGQATQHHEFNNDKNWFLFSSRNRLS